MRAYSLDLRERVVRAVEAGTARAVVARRPPGRRVRIGPDVSLVERVERWAAERGVRVTIATMHRAIARLGRTRRKRPSMPASRTP